MHERDRERENYAEKGGNPFLHMIGSGPLPNTDRPTNASNIITGSDVGWQVRTAVKCMR